MTNAKLRPMKATEYDPEKARFPGWASPKYDGVRCWGMSAGAFSNTLKVLPNTHVQDQFKQHSDIVNGLDGELVVGPANHPNVMQATTSGVMSRDGIPDFTYLVFDAWSLPNMPFVDRKLALEECHMDFPPWVTLVHHKWIENQEKLDAYEAEQIELGYEGIMYRAADACSKRNQDMQYKYGRSTASEAFLLKVKRFSDAEAYIIGFEELMHNENEAEIDELGLTKRSSHQENLVPSGMIGAYLVRSDEWPEPFKISCGSMTHDERREAWRRRANDMGRPVTFKYFKHGVKTVPRHGIFKAYRDPMDITNY